MLGVPQVVVDDPMTFIRVELADYHVAVFSVRMLNYAEGVVKG